MKKRAISFVLCLVLCLTCLPVAALADTRNTAMEEGLAYTLKTLGLFQGINDTDFALERSPTRAEALVMLIRLLGKEEDVNKNAYRHPFTDVDSWADRYVGYAYQNHLTKGESTTEFGMGIATAEMYLTFTLRALGYSDENDLDFSWDKPFTLAKKIGILPDGTDTENFWRADVVRISYAALKTPMKNSGQTLADKLISQGVFTQAVYNSVYKTDVFDLPYTERTKLDAEQIYSRCSPAVFRIEIYNSSDNPFAQGSGFFIDSSGIAVTNNHVLKNALSATATLTDGRTLRITGVLSYDAELDYAVIKVEGSGFPSLSVGDSSRVKGGETIYTIGSPQGLYNSIGDGIVSNPRRTDYNNMIQFTAPISSGSSGGALINSYGEVIGITTATISSENSNSVVQSLNFAVPINDVVQGKDIANFANEHDIMSLQDYARRNGNTSVSQPSTTPQQPSTTPQQPSVSSRAQALEALKSFVGVNFNGSGDNYKCYYLYDDATGVQFSIYHRDSQDDLVLNCSLYDAPNSCYSFLYLDNESTNVTARFTYYAPSDATEPLVSGSAVLDAADIYQSADFSFTNYNGPSSMRSGYETLAMTMYYGSVNLVETLFRHYISGSYSVADLGFTNFQSG